MLFVKLQISLRHGSERLEHFLKELQRRNVVKVSLAYLAVAWLIIQLVGEIGPILNAPEWFPRLVLGLLLAGFLIATVLAWVYELTNKGLRRTEEVDRDESLHSQHGRQLNFIIIGALLLALVYFIWESRFSDLPETFNPLESVAVLPFRDLSEAGDQAYFAEGISEECLNVLSRLPGLKVAGRSSSFSFRNTDKEPAEIARALGVTHLLEGSVRTSGDQLRVTAQLVSGVDGFQLWSRVFDGRVEEVFKVQDQIAGLVVEALRSQLEGEPVEALPAATATNMDAYKTYLLGRYELAQRTGESIRLAAGHFRRAIELDPQYAPARSALAKTLVISPYYEILAPPADLFAEAGELAARAIDFDEDNSEARSVLGTIAMMYKRDWEQARVQLLSSVEIHPNDAGNLNLYGDFLYNVGDYRAALETEGLAAALDPLSATFQHELALVHAFLGEYGQAITLEQRAVNLNPEFSNAWNTLARLYLVAGQKDAFEALHSSGQARFSYSFRASLAVRRALEDGEPVVALPSIEQLRGDAEQGNVAPTVLAYLYAQSGDDLQAAYWVQRAHGERDPILLSPMYFFLPEDWPELPVTQLALGQADLEELFELRRQHIATGNGRRQSFDLKFR